MKIVLTYNNTEEQNAAMNMLTIADIKYDLENNIVTIDDNIINKCLILLTMLNGLINGEISINKNIVSVLVRESIALQNTLILKEPELD